MEYLEERVARIEDNLEFIKKMLTELASGTKEALIEFEKQIETEFNDIKSSLGIKQESIAKQEIKRK